MYVIIAVLLLIICKYLLHVNVVLYTINKTTLKTLIKLPDRRYSPQLSSYGYRMGIISLSAHTRPIYPIHFAGNLYPARITATITPI